MWDSWCSGKLKLTLTSVSQGKYSTAWSNENGEIYPTVRKETEAKRDTNAEQDLWGKHRSILGTTLTSKLTHHVTGNAWAREKNAPLSSPFSTLFVHTDCTTIFTTCRYLNCTLIFFLNNAMSVLVTFPVSHSSGRHCSWAYFPTQLGLLNVLVVTSIWYDDYSKPRFFPSKKVGTLKVSVPLSADLPCGSLWSGRGLGTRHGIIPGLPVASHDTLLTAFCLTIILMNIIFLMIHHSLF